MSTVQTTMVTLTINGRELTGSQPFEAFRRIIDEELIRAKR